MPNVFCVCVSAADQAGGGSYVLSVSRILAANMATAMAPPGTAPATPTGVASCATKVHISCYRMTKGQLVFKLLRPSLGHLVWPEGCLAALISTVLHCNVILRYHIFIIKFKEISSCQPLRGLDVIIEIDRLSRHRDKDPESEDCTYAISQLKNQVKLTTKFSLIV